MTHHAPVLARPLAVRFANGKAVRGATGAKLKVRKRFEGQRIRVKVTGSRPGYLAVTKKSKRTDPVV